MNNGFTFLTVGQTVDSTTTGFKRYIGLANSKVLAVNPDKATLDKLLGYETKNEPVYVNEAGGKKECYINFVVQTVPSVNNGVKITQLLRFTLRNAPALTQDESQVTIIDGYGDCAKMETSAAKAGKVPVSKNGKDLRVVAKYRMAYDGEAALVSFLKALLGVPLAWDYKNGMWVLKEESEAKKGEFRLDNIKDYFNGDFSELREALALQPNSEVKLLYGINTSVDAESGQTRHYQSVCSREGFFLRGNASTKAIERLAKDLAGATFNNSVYQVCPLKEWTVEATNLETAPSNTDADMWGSDTPQTNDNNFDMPF